MMNLWRRLMWVLFRWPSVVLWAGHDVVPPVRLLRRQFDFVYVKIGGNIEHILAGYKVEGRLHATRWSVAPWCVGWKAWPIIDKPEP